MGIDASLLSVNDHGLRIGVDVGAKMGCLGAAIGTGAAMRTRHWRETRNAPVGNSVVAKDGTIDA